MAKKTATTMTAPVAAAPKGGAPKPVTPAKTPASAPATPVSSTPVRNSAVPKAAPAPAPLKSKEVTHEMIARRAYEISISGSGGSDFDNWIRAERELRGA